MAIANGSVNYTPPANIRRMSDELAYLPAYFSEDGDYILMKEKPDVEFLKSREKIFGLKCNLVTWEDAQELELNELRPWGWSPRVHRLFQHMKMHTSVSFRQGVMGNWPQGREKWYSRKMSVACLHKLQQQIILPCDIKPEICISFAEIGKIVRRKAAVVKSPWSSSGKGIRMLPCGDINKKDQEWLSGVLQKQGYVMVEPRLNRVCDFAMEFYINEIFHVEFLGLSYFYTGKQGEYKGNYLGSEGKIERKLLEYMDRKDLQHLKEILVSVLEQIYRGVYSGYLGVDMMVFMDNSGKYQVHPCVEINLRYNMGILAWKLGKHYIHPSSEGLFQIHFFSQSGAGYHYYQTMKERYPPDINREGIRSGYISLTPVGKDTKFIADMVITSL